MTALATFTKKKYVVTVNVAGTGGGAVSGDLACDATSSPCKLTLEHGTALALTAGASAGSSFVGWSGACGGTSGCTIPQVTAALTIGANFSKVVAGSSSLVVAKSGKGSVTSTPSGISCGWAAPGPMLRSP